jgi:hypothetical protein
LDGQVIQIEMANGTFGATIVAKSDAFTVNQGGWTSFNDDIRQVADVNGDGGADIVGFSTDAVYTALGQTNGTFGATMAATYEFLPTQGWNNFDQYPRQVADINGDRRADIVAFGYDTVYVALGQTNGTFAASFAATSYFYNY